MLHTLLHDHKWSGLRRFAGFACGLACLTLLSAIGMMATMGHDFRAVDGVAIAWMFAAFPLLAALAARRLGAPARPRNVAITALLAAIVMLVLLRIPGALSGPRMLIGGRTSGTVEQVSASQAGYAEVAPARVWIDRAEYGIATEFKNGRSTSTSVYVAPIVPEIPWSGEMSLFVCGDRDDVFAADPASGSLAGVLAPADGLAGSGVRKLAAKDLPVGPSPRCLAPTQGSYAGVFALRLLFLVLVVTATIAAATWALVRGALGR